MGSGGYVCVPGSAAVMLSSQSIYHIPTLDLLLFTPPFSVLASPTLELILFTH